MICPIMSIAAANYHECKADECALWIGDSKQGNCAIKANAMNTGDIGDVNNNTECLVKAIASLSNRLGDIRDDI